MNTFVESLLPRGLPADLQIQQVVLLSSILFIREALEVVEHRVRLARLDGVLIDLKTLRILLGYRSVAALLFPFLRSLINAIKRGVLRDRRALLILLIDIALVGEQRHVAGEDLHVFFHFHDDLALRRRLPRLLHLFRLLSVIPGAQHQI